MNDRSPMDPRFVPHRHPLVGRRDAYEVMADMGIDVSSAAIDVSKAGMNAQRTGKLGPEHLNALAELRSTERRLFLDLEFVHPPRPEPGGGARSVLEAEPCLELEPLPPPSLCTIVHAIGPPPTTTEQQAVPVFTTPNILLDAWGLAADLLERVEPGERPLAEVESVFEEE